MIFSVTQVFLFIGVFAASVIATRLVLIFLRHKAILDLPNERSSHSLPTPRGGGIGMLIPTLPCLWFLNHNELTALPGAQAVILGAFALALISWLDDLKNLGAASRFIGQIIAVTICLYFMPVPPNGYLGGFLPVIAEKVLLGVGWIWFINLFNFMDGIDGISGVEIMSISCGLIIITAVAHLNPALIDHGVVLMGAAAGFLIWNWHKAKVFMGDVGSIPMGFLLGWLLILLIGEGYLIPALIIALYYLGDATVTLLKRAARGEKVWQAHREHFYQKATQSGLAHNEVVTMITRLNVALILCAYIAVRFNEWIGLTLASGLTIWCLVYFSRLYQRKQPPKS